MALFQPFNLQSYVALVGSPPSSLALGYALGGLHSCSAKVRSLHPRSKRFPSPFVPLLYHTLRGLSRTFFKFFLVEWMGFEPTFSPTFRHREVLPISDDHPLLAPLLYHILSGLSRGLLKKIATFFQRAVSYTVWAWLRHTDFSVLYPNGAGSTRPVPYPLDTTDYSTSIHGFQ